MQEAFGFMFFSTLEAFSWFLLSMYIFRYKPFKYAGSALIVIFLMNLDSFILRNELSLANYVPLINILIFVFYYAVVVKIPLIGSLIVTLAGFAGFGLIQAALTFILFGSIEAAQSTVSNGYALQTATAIVVFIVGVVPYKLGYGISVPFEKMKFKLEEIITSILMVLFLCIISFVLYVNNLMLLVLLFAVTLGYLLYFSVMKDRSFE
ncbi:MULTISPECIES: hypothetical protein [Paenibacillus]|uniref:Uncharacterized protein n=1 Tax=Paenibacillus taichungensis TaxID=484184 RepID=A0ABX2MGP7_9BACL|nr:MULTISPECIES: hypothetical protein [Paenibacillus]NUU54091.1 hypothetical protein [Paenibacillus taichungensis]SLJ98050.1 hypothetical protein SAMN06272722_102685 [Paenibacillus sp. RU5A]SOC66830.1 hypothetical protein SAMN05880581_102312 [Paenibacillus sp. RU26A]SOC70021.1 hypothetical protein SAMN05880586_102685 [Paenibacillus sp. RU5M]